MGTSYACWQEGGVKKIIVFLISRTESRIQRVVNLPAFVKPFSSDYVKVWWCVTRSGLALATLPAFRATCWSESTSAAGRRRSVALSHLRRVTPKMSESSLSLFTPRHTLSPPTTHILVCPQASLSLLLSAEGRTLRSLMNLSENRRPVYLGTRVNARARTHTHAYVGQVSRWVN